MNGLHQATLLDFDAWFAVFLGRRGGLLLVLVTEEWGLS